MKLPLSIPPEPVSLKADFKKGLDTNFRGTIPAIKQSTWAASYLWTNYRWGLILKRYGFSWQMFMKAVRTNSLNFLRWIQGEKTWDEAIKDLITIIEEMLEEKQR
ncbi:hypothetical protein DRN44_07125 [Thermococci archaeon]|nr:MAG: hypothetical protein DRN44_07125 [Thermococci archaeon]